jgi:pyridoxamine 5'-phosphate oxidase
MAKFEVTADPLALFADWLGEAETGEPEDPNAMALATVDADGMPDVRMVLLKGFDAAGFVFYTNRDSIKGAELAANPRAALCFHWKSIGRQVRVRGDVAEVTAEEADAYFSSRPKGSRIGAWASRQSQPLESRLALEKAVARYTAKFGLTDVPRPDYWTGYRLAPRRIEFWRKQTFRLHDRIAFTRGADGEWEGVRLYP